MSKERLTKMAGGALKDVVPVSGKVLVDGEPKGNVNLFLHPADGGPSILSIRTNPDGTYCWSTHSSCDGLEPGDYVIAFTYVPKLKRNESNEISGDLFKGKYGDPKKSAYKLSVAKGTPQKDVDYDLKTK